MGLENGPRYPSDLNTAWPLESDAREQGAAHLRNLKTVFRSLFPNVSGAITATQDKINAVLGYFSDSGDLTASSAKLSGSLTASTANLTGSMPSFNDSKNQGAVVTSQWLFQNYLPYAGGTMNGALIVQNVSDWGSQQAVGASDADGRYIQKYHDDGTYQPQLLTVRSGGIIAVYASGEWFTAQPYGNYATSAELASEVSRAQNAESGLNSVTDGLNSTVNNLSSSLSSEVSRAQNAESGLSGRIDNLNNAAPIPQNEFIQSYTTSGVASKGTINFPTQFGGTPRVIIQNGDASDQNVHAYNPTPQGCQVWINNGGTSGIITVWAQGPR